MYSEVCELLESFRKTRYIIYTLLLPLNTHMYIPAAGDIYFHPIFLGGGPQWGMGPMAFSLAAPAPSIALFERPGLPGSMGPPSGSMPAPQIRKEFPENWIFYDVKKYEKDFESLSFGWLSICLRVWFIFKFNLLHCY